MKIEVWSDVVCPWCYIGKRRLEAALAGFEHRDDVDVAWRSYELDPGAPRERAGDPAERVARKYGVSVERARAMNARVTALANAEGLDYRLERARGGNTFDAHRLLHLARDRGLQDAMKERLLGAYLTEGVSIGDDRELIRLATGVGLDEHEVRDVLAGDAYGEAVRKDERLAQGLGVTGVPFFVVDRRYAVGGAQSPDFLLDLIEQAWDASVEATEA